MPPLRTLVVDDEFLALNLLENFVEQTPQLQLVAKEKSPLRALEILQTNTIDVLFLDIQMPVLAGNQLLKILQRPPLTVFTTAYADYAVEGFELNAVDYLLKPFSFDRFLQAVNKVVERHRSLSPAISTTTFTTNEPAFISVKVDGSLRKIFYQDILFIEGLREYVRFHCTDGKYVVLERMKNLAEQLPDNFLRVHRSYIVAKNRVESLIGNQLQLGQHKIPISRGNREEILKAIF
ncbi:MAG: LytR/AlgR family response regulator transcription factor [Saprospiraceae bacterium]